MTEDLRIPRPTVDQEAVLTHLHAARRRPTPAAIWTAVGDIPVLLAEVDRLARLLAAPAGTSPTCSPPPAPPSPPTTTASPIR